MALPLFFDMKGHCKQSAASTSGGLGTPLHTFHYAYDATWKDMLKSYDNVAITCDEIGNLKTDGTWTYEWQAGRQLESMTKTGTTATFAYNADGLRVRKTVGSTVTDYTLHGKQIVHMKQGSNNLHFFYDAQGRPAVVEFASVKYGYVYNLQGDVVAIIDGSGNPVVEYTYDAWGKPLSKTGTLATTLGTLNPFRYRGYVFDEETGLYYLRSRYYNPVWGRLVNADSNYGSNRLISHNIFAYCMNNFLVMCDSDGKTPSHFISYKLYADWYYEVHTGHGKWVTGKGFLKHILVYNKHGKYALNSDGSYHDDPGDPPGEVRDALKEKKPEWDWDELRRKYTESKIEETPISSLGMMIEYLRPENRFIDDYGEITSPIDAEESCTPGVLVTPILPSTIPSLSLSPSSIPSFAFSFAW